MKTHTIFSVLFAAATLWSTTVATAQQPVTTGTVVGVSKEEGTITIRRTEQPAAPITFHGMDKTNLQMADGQVATIDGVTPGMMATVYYSQVGNKMMVSKVQVQAARAGTAAGVTTTTSSPTKGSSTVTTAPANPPVSSAVPITPGTAAAVRSKAANDGDITTQPGSKAAVDGDITTQPGSKAAVDGDITTQPGSKAAVDGDITTQPGSKSTSVPRDRSN